MALADSVDLSFTNNIGLDAIAVVGCTTSIKGLTKALGRPGSYTYKVLRTHESQCIKLNILAGSIICIIILALNSKLTAMYTLTNTQHKLLSGVLIQLAFYVPADAIHDITSQIAMLKGHLKRYNISLIIFYILEIGGDAIVFISTKNLSLIYFTTTLAFVVTSIYLLRVETIDNEKLTIKFIKETAEYWVSKSAERFLNGLTHTIYGILATRMGEIQYAIHSVLFNIAVNAETITNGYHCALLLKVKINQTFKDAIEDIKKWATKTVVPLFVIYSTYSIILLVICKGEIQLKLFIPWIFFYLLEFFGLYIYETATVLTFNQRTSKVFPLGTMLGTIVRIGISLIGLQTLYPLAFFGSAIALDWLSRGIAFYILTKRIKIKENKIAKEIQQ
jgi:hypothetical protein